MFPCHLKAQSPILCEIRGPAMTGWLARHPRSKARYLRALNRRQRWPQGLEALELVLGYGAPFVDLGSKSDAIMSVELLASTPLQLGSARAASTIIGGLPSMSSAVDTGEHGAGDQQASSS